MKKQLRPVVREQNVRRFSGNGAVEGMRGIMLPKDPSTHSLAHLRAGDVSIYSEVVMGRLKKNHIDRAMRVCQDATLIISDEGHHLIALFDGFGPFGSTIPKVMCESIHSLWQESGKGIESQEGALEFLLEASRRAINPMVEKVLSGQRNALREWEELLAEIRKDDPEATPPPKPMVPEPREMEEFKGGTTAIMAAVRPDGRYFIASAGDSAGYDAAADGKVRRLLDYESMWHDDGLGNGRLELSALSLRSYASLRNVVDSSIGANDCDVPAMRKIETAEGMLGKGGMLILVSDGITKNLWIVLDSEGWIHDVSGEPDIRKMLAAFQDAEGLGMELMGLVRARMNLVKDGAYLNLPSRDSRALIPADDDASVLVLKKE
ncbi:MAG: PP2C family serine/threonine-protein phosphatase [Candidatus Micrarchaeota archaeon]